MSHQYKSGVQYKMNIVPIRTSSKHVRVYHAKRCGCQKWTVTEEKKLLTSSSKKVKPRDKEGQVMIWQNASSVPIAQAASTSPLIAKRNDENQASAENHYNNKSCAAMRCKKSRKSTLIIGIFSNWSKY